MSRSGQTAAPQAACPRVPSDIARLPGNRRRWMRSLPDHGSRAAAQSWHLAMSLRPPDRPTRSRYTRSASGIASASDQVVLAKRFSLSRSPGAHHACETFNSLLDPQQLPSCTQKALAFRFLKQRLGPIDHARIDVVIAALGSRNVAIDDASDQARQLAIEMLGAIGRMQRVHPCARSEEIDAIKTFSDHRISQNFLSGSG